MATDRIPDVRELRNPAYTGRNRCLPCTVLNVGIAVVLCVAVAVLASPVVGAAALVGSAAAIYFRGYLIPYTPTITRRYFPRRVLEWFGKRDGVTDAGGATPGEAQPVTEPGEAVDETGSVTEPGEAPGETGSVTDAGEAAGETQSVTDPGEAPGETPLASLGVLEAGGDDVRLAPSFAAEWEREIDETRDDPTGRLADRLGLTDPEIRTRNGVCVVRDGDREVTQWLSEGALVADVAALPVLRSRADGWESLSEDDRAEVLSELRLFLDECPNCDGSLAFDTRLDESGCCYDREVTVYRCTECDSLLTRLR